MLRIRRRYPRRARPYLAHGSSTRTRATTQTRGGKSPLVRMAATVEVAGAWVAGIPAGGTAGAVEGGGKAMKNGQKSGRLFSPRKQVHLRLRGGKTILVVTGD